MAEVRNKRDIIKDEAMRLFAERGVDAVSIRDIAAFCDMKAPNLYAHFKSREELIAELFCESYALYGDLIADAISNDGNFKNRLHAMVRAICDFHDKDVVRFRFLILSQHASLVRVPRDERNPVELICRMVAQAMVDDDIPKREPEVVCMGMVGIIVQIATGILYGRIKGGMSERSDAIFEMCWRVAS